MSLHFYHGENRRRSYFEGWYVKHQTEDATLALIPGIHIEADGTKKAFIQILTTDDSYFVEYPFASFQARKKPFGVRIGDCVFSEQGAYLHIQTPEVRLHGKLHYGPLAPLETDIMGPFQRVPFLECRHRVLSMRHALRGQVNWQGKTVHFDGGVGYMEMDWGSSFPSSYIWTQCNDAAQDVAVMVSIANIPYLGRSFQGCIAAVRYRGREIRLATYNGVKIRKYSESGLVLQQKKYCLKIEVTPRSPQELKAPSNGHMSRVIRENAACRARYRLYEGYRLLFDVTSDKASYEAVE